MLGALAVAVLWCAGCGGTETPTPAPATTVSAMPAPLIPRVVREPLSPEGNRAGQEVAAGIRSAVEQVCASGDFSLDATRKALAGHDARVFRADESVTGVAFVITLPQACVLGELRPGAVLISVEGLTKRTRCE